MEGSAYDAQPYFASGDRTRIADLPLYTLYEGDVDKDATARIIYQTDVTVLELNYPKDASQLEPGKLYSWRVSTPTSAGRSRAGGPNHDSRVRKRQRSSKALTTAGLTTPKTAADKLIKPESLRISASGMTH